MKKNIKNHLIKLGVHKEFELEEEAIQNRKDQGFKMTPTKRRIFSLGFHDGYEAYKNSFSKSAYIYKLLCEEVDNIVKFIDEQEGIETPQERIDKQLKEVEERQKYLREIASDDVDRQYEEAVERENLGVLHEKEVLSNNMITPQQKIQHQIELHEQEILESMDDINVQTRSKPLTEEQVLWIANNIKAHRDKINTLKGVIELIS